MPDARECASLMFNTMFSMRSVFGALRQNQSEEDALSIGQIRILGILLHAPRTLSELASLHHVTPSTMSRTVDVLVRRNWVARQPAPHDRRQVILTVTEEGQELVKTSRQQAHDAVTKLFTDLSDDERTRLYDGLLVLQSVIERTGKQNCQE